jgi:ABC-type Mn2+/Zn2+ transport system permease subunit
VVLSLSILVTLTVIGVTLVAAMLVIPAVVARMLTLSTIVGSACGLVGMYLSYYAGVPSGTMIVLVGAAVFLVVLGITTLRRRSHRIIADGHAPARATVKA